MTYSGIMNCIRCGKEIPHPDSTNADYIIAKDTIAREPVEVFIALKQNQATLAKAAKITERDEHDALKYPDLVIDDSEYDQVEVLNVEVARAIGEDLVKVVAGIKKKDIQKTGIVCPGCYKPTDKVIWGVHKGK